MLDKLPNKSLNYPYQKKELSIKSLNGSHTKKKAPKQEPKLFTQIKKFVTLLLTHKSIIVNGKKREIKNHCTTSSRKSINCE